MPKSTYSIRFTILDDALLAQLAQHQIEVVVLEVLVNESNKKDQIHEIILDELKQYYQSRPFSKVSQLQEQLRAKGFSERDLKVLHALCDGLTSKEIGEQLHVSKKTIDLIRTKLLRAYDVKTSNELIRLSIIDGLYTPRSNEAIQAEKDRLAEQQLERRKKRLLGE
jgi:ATP/maltotriose-dependent transcriptional regulator MalT